MQFLFNFIKGSLIGIGAILPGVSSGVICMVLGIYEKLIDCILGFFKNIKKNLKFLFPIALGVMMSCILFSNILVYFFNKIPMQTKSLFIGLLLGSIYVLYCKEIKNNISKSKYKISDYIIFITCLFVGVTLIFFENNAVYDNGYYPNEFSFLFLILSGFFMSFGIIIPRSKQYCYFDDSRRL